MIRTPRRALLRARTGSLPRSLTMAANRFVDYLKEVKPRCRVKPFLVSHGDDITSAPTLISRPKSVKYGPNFRENHTYSGPNLILFRTGFAKN